MARAYAPRIQPANLADLPTVLDSEQASHVLRISVERVRQFTAEGKLRRLRYAKDYLYSAAEIERFLDEWTGVE